MSDDVLLMAVDLGTSFIKVGVYTLQGECVALEKQVVKDTRPEPGVFIQRGEELFESVVLCIKAAAISLGNRAKNVEAISFTGQMAGFMGVDEAWQDVTGWSCSLDTRYSPYAQRQLEELKDEFLLISGTSSPLFSAKYEWFKDCFPQDEKRIVKYLMISGYIIGRLGDIKVEDAVIDGSLITWTGLADVKRREWSHKICKRVGLDESRLPRITESAAVAAHLSEHIASVTGLKSGIPLISGAGDKIAGCVGAASLEKGSLLFEAGSFGGISFAVGDYRPDKESMHYDLVNGCRRGDMYAHYYMPGSGLTLDWFVRDIMGEGSLSEGYRKMDEKMQSVAVGSDGLVAIGMLSGTVMPFQPRLKGVWAGHTLAHRPEHFYRALREGFGYALAGAIEQMERMYPEHKAKSMRIIGGGARSNANSQLLADITGKPIEAVSRDDCSLWGACILATSGIGMVQDMGEFADKNISVSRVFKPNAENHTKYLELKKRYEEFSQIMTDFF